MPTLGLPEVLNAAYKLNDWLNFYWNFYVAFTGVVIGWVFSSKGWPTAQKAIVTAFYLGFVGVSIHALWKTYESLNAAVSRLQQLIAPEDPLARALAAQLGHSDMLLGIGLHVVGDALVLFCAWRFTTKPPAADVGPNA
jgi:hypothetical protein